MILIRADANETIGAGHVMRCLSVAHAFTEIGEKVRFVTADHRGDRLINQQGFDTICLNSNYTELESEKLGIIVEEIKPYLLLTDSYCVTQPFFERLKKLVHTAYFDDLNKECWCVDYLINYNIFAGIMDYSRYDGTGTKLLLGTQYAPLRKEFNNCTKHPTGEVVKDVLISAGGADPECVAEKIMLEICPEMANLRFHFVIGALNPRLTSIKQLAEGKGNIILHINERHMCQLMEQCDIAISAAGSTLYELCATGTPTITYTLADNQIAATEQFEKQEIMLSAGDCRNSEVFVFRLRTILQSIIRDSDLRGELSSKMQTLVDGNGAGRIVDALRPCLKGKSD